MTNEQLAELVWSLVDEILEKLEVEDKVEHVYASIDSDSAYVSVDLKQKGSKRGATWKATASVDRKSVV